MASSGVLKERSEFSSEPLAAFKAQQTPDDEPTSMSTVASSGDPPPESNASKEEDYATTRLKILTGLAPKNETSKRPPNMKLPGVNTGSEASKFRSWWHSVRGYMKVHEPTMPSGAI